ncbi:hypothetical protein BgiBS90_029509, partial [Biomphalaria glabrata]
MLLKINHSILIPFANKSNMQVRVRDTRTSSGRLDPKPIENEWMQFICLLQAETTFSFL